jgi:hypothetical protein
LLAQLPTLAAEGQGPPPLLGAEHMPKARGPLPGSLLHEPARNSRNSPEEWGRQDLGKLREAGLPPTSRFASGPRDIVSFLRVRPESLSAQLSGSATSGTC